MVEPPAIALRRVPPDPVQFQVMLGSLLGDGRLVGLPRARRLRIAHREDRSHYVRWKYERLGPLAADPPRMSEDAVSFDTIAHPIFDDLVPLFNGARGRQRVMRELLAPLGLAVWMCDNGRIELRADVFVPLREAA